MHFPKNRVRLCLQIIEQQFIPALVIGSAITPNLRNHTMIKCPRCDGTTIKAQNHYEFYDIYECVRVAMDLSQKVKIVAEIQIIL